MNSSYIHHRPSPPTNSPPVSLCHRLLIGKCSPTAATFISSSNKSFFLTSYNPLPSPSPSPSPSSYSSSNRVVSSLLWDVFAPITPCTSPGESSGIVIRLEHITFLLLHLSNLLPHGSTRRYG
ncbi:hypothetical protein U1Q18_015745 [Sarracenia purpurea var. burkii]